MKKIFRILLSVALFSVVASCTTNIVKTEWSHEQRKAMRRALSEYRDMVYLDEMTDAEFLLFTGDVTDEIESVYPLYTSVIAFPNVTDTLQMYITTTIVERLDADGSNIRHIYPYRELRKAGRLPENLTRQQQRMFYKCLARKVNARYSDFGSFMNAVIADTTDKSAIATMEAGCAKDLFDF